MSGGKTVEFKVPESWRRQWPCSKLAGKNVKASYAANGDMVDLIVTNADGTLADVDDLEAAELQAAQENAESEPRDPCPTSVATGGKHGCGGAVSCCGGARQDV